MRRARHRGPSPRSIDFCKAQQGRAWSWSGRRRRWPPASSTILPAAGIRAFGPTQGRRRGSKRPRASPRTSARPTASRPPLMSASTAMPRAAKRYVRAQARRSWSRRTGSPPARASSSPQTIEEAKDAIDMPASAAASARPAREVVVEEFLHRRGSQLLRYCPTASVRCRSASAQDHKRAFDGDKRPEHRRHGRLFAGAGDDAGGDERARDGRNHPADASRAMKATRHAVSRACCSPG